jgi:hypothetical protein
MQHVEADRGHATVRAMRRWLGIGMALCCALVGAAPAAANPAMESLFQDDDMLLHSPIERVDAAMAELKAIGVDRVRIPALWRDIAPLREPADPTDPRQYPDARINKLDRTISSAYAHGLSVLLNVRGGAPEWAQPRRPARIREEDAYKPSPRKFHQYVEMLGRRYSGAFVDMHGVTLPYVNAWSIWNEPNWGGLLQPQSRRGKPYGPHHYRRLVRSATSALQKTGHGEDMILLGETAPLGVDAPGPTRSLKAVKFYRELFCFNARLKPRRRCGDYQRKGPLDVTGVAHHPYPVLSPPEQRSSDDGYIRLADSRRLYRLLDAAARHGRVPEERLPIWYTEFGYQTRPPDPYRGISLRKQAEWNVRAEYVAFKQPRVLSMAQFLLRDTPPRRQYRPSERLYWSTYQTGLRFDDGRKKPAYDAYRLPLLRLDRHRFWGIVRPAPYDSRPTVRIEHRRSGGGGWQPVAEREVTNPRGYFTVRLQFPRRGDYRAVWRDVASLTAASR